MSMLFSRIVSADPYVVELFHNTKLIHVHADWFDGSDEATDRMQTAISRFTDAKSFNYWLGWFELSLIATFEGESESERIAKQLTGNRPAIYRYLSQHTQGVTFSEFCNYLDPATGRRLTESEDPFVVATMLRKMSQSLVRYGQKIESKPRQNLIKLSSRK